jgi:hypothetical protein
MPCGPGTWPAREVALQLIVLRDVVRIRGGAGFGFPISYELARLERHYDTLAKQPRWRPANPITFPEWVR